MEEFSVRLDNALRKRHMTPAELSRKLGVSEGTISSYRSGAYKPKQNRLEQIAMILDVSIAYLFGADVEFEPYYTNKSTQSDEHTETQKNTNTYTLDTIEREIIETYRKSDGKQKMSIIYLVSEIAKEIEKNTQGTNGNGKAV